jgi:hypothetical protein
LLQDRSVVEDRQHTFESRSEDIRTLLNSGWRCAFAFSDFLIEHRCSPLIAGSMIHFSISGRQQLGVPYRTVRTEGSSGHHTESELPVLNASQRPSEKSIPIIWLRYFSPVMR